MMRCLDLTTRSLVTTSLILSMGLAGMFPHMMVLAENGMRMTVAPSPTPCCCGTDSGDCCGMGCCLARQAPAKEPSPVTNPKSSRDGPGTPLSVALAQALLGERDTSAAAGNRRPENDLAGLLAPTSLQDRHIRIDA